LWFPTQPAGEYLWVADNPVKPPIGHWQDVNDIDPDGQAFLGGQETVGDFPMQIVYPASGKDTGLDFEAHYITQENVPAIVLNQPIADAVVTDNPPSVTWTAIPGATNYTVQWSQDNNFGADVIAEATSTTNSLKLPASLATGRWFWRVKAQVSGTESGYTTDSFQLAPVIPAAGGEVVLEDFEDLTDWVVRAITIESSDDPKHGGAHSMKADFGTVHGYVAADAPIGRLLPKSPDGSNPTQAFLWTYVDEPIEGDVNAVFNVMPGGGTITLPLTLDAAGRWMKQELDFAGTAAEDPANTISLFSLQRPSDFSGPAQSVYFDDFGAVYAPSTGTLGVKGDMNGDGKVNVQDATISLRIAVSLLTATDIQKTLGDMNGDGKLNVQDATLILRKAVGL
jgi:hypothetical protein